MRLKWLTTTIALVILVMIAFVGLARQDAVLAAQDTSSKVEGALQDEFAANGSADYIIHFAEQADLSAAYGMDWDARGQYVYDTLRQTAERSQAHARALLDASGLKYRAFINGNELYVWGGTSTNAVELAALPEISFIRATQVYSIDPVAEEPVFSGVRWAGDLLANHALTTVGTSIQATMAWGITDTKANLFWSTFGVQGNGILVANIDTGVQYNHPALDQSYRCSSNPSDPKCWYDPANICGGLPCDNNGHGTHTMGTMVADDDPSLTYIAGMAPGAQWIACKGCETSDCSDLSLNSCADWLLAPGGSAANRPQVVNNSWGGGSGDIWFQDKVQAWVAAGIFPAFSAGNSGPACSTLGSPGDYQVSFGSAAHDSSRNIALFSSRGPSVAFGDTPYTKPNISAPGVSICSSVPVSSWSCGYSGTSMASPHSAGAVALLWSCNPELVGQVDATFIALQNNTDPAPDGTCGAPLDGEGNYTYGYGYLDVLKAGQDYCGAQLGSIDGYVYDQDNNPVKDASVRAVPSILGEQAQGATDPTGYYTITVPAGMYDVTASKDNYTTQTVSGVEVIAHSTTSQDFTLTALPTWTEIALPPGCPDWNRFDGEYFPRTGLVYFLGGRYDTATNGTIYAYNPSANTCTNTGESMPTPISNYTVSLVSNGTDDVLCTFGGRDAAGVSTLAVQCYNPRTNTASNLNSMPSAWTGYNTYTQVVVDNMVYIFGGFNSTTSPYMTARTERYNPVANAFQQMGNLSLARSYIMAAAVDGKIYAFGGDTYDGANLHATTRAEVFDPPSETWYDLPVADLPDASGEGRAFGFDSASPYQLAGKVILAGGGQWPADTNMVLAYDVASDTYDVTFADLNVSRRDQAGFFIPGNPGAMWVFGGRSGTDLPPYAPPEYLSVMIQKNFFLPLLKK